MAKLCKKISLNDDWAIEGMAFDQGLALKAYGPDYTPQEPVRTTVPAIVQNALFAAKKIPDPFFEDNNEKIVWIENRDWWYFKDFSVPKNIRGKRIRIIFEGITYKGDVWLNGLTLGKVEGMFLRHTFDITRLVKPGQKCRLALRLRALENSSEDRPGGRIQRGIVRSSGVVAPFSYWWNWSPHLVPIGIWKQVWLRVTGRASIDDPYVKTKIEWTQKGRAKAAQVKIEADLKSFEPKKQDVFIQGTISGIGFKSREIRFRQKFSIAPGTDTKVRLKSVRIKFPKLWWPNGMGDQSLYKLVLKVADSRGNVLDTTETSFGIREVAWVRNWKDEWVQKVHGQTNRLWSIVGKPHAWTFKVNRKRIFIKGSNWLPSDNLFRFSEARYRLFLDQAQAAKFNMLRVWGGGINETREFYNLCDQKGILLWTDFWLSCASYPAMPHDLFIKCVADAIKIHRNHPSLVMWCGGNEFNADEDETRDLVDKMEAAVQEYDPARPFRRGSPYKGNRHGGLLMLPTRTSNKYHGDILQGPSRLTLFRSEVAVMRSAPFVQSIRKFIGRKNIWPINKKKWQYHHAVVEEQERDACEYGGKKDLDHWIMAGQIAHGQVHRHNLEYCRQTKYHCSGCLQWQVNGSWPSFHRELIDWYGLPKGSFYAYKRSAADVIVAADMEKYVWDGGETFKAPVYGISDLYKDIKNCTLRAVILDTRMRPLYAKSKKRTLKKDASTWAFDIKWKIPADFLKKVFLVHLWLMEGKTKLADNLYWCGTSAFSRPKRFMIIGGRWQIQAGTKSVRPKWKNTIIPSYWKKPPEAPPKHESLFYRKIVKIPLSWKGTPLELYCQGFEGNDEVCFNGKRIGRTEETMTVKLGTDARVYSEKGSAGWEKVKQAKGKRNIRVSSDPFTVPNLIKRFYAIPPKAIKWNRANIIEIRLFGKYATGISEPVYIRSCSSDQMQKQVIDYDNRRAYLGEISSLPSVSLEVDVKTKKLVLRPGGSTVINIRLINPTGNLAFYTGISLAGLDQEVVQIYSDNYFALLPGATKNIKVFLIHSQGCKGRKKVQFKVSGWNVRPAKIGKPFYILLK